jgi:L-threonylcarbamoyladenylate synthase
VSRVLAYRTDAARESAAPDVAAHLAGGGIVIYPTETVYGLGSTLDSRGLGKLARFKGGRPFLLLISGADQAPELEWTPDARRLAQAFWPGPLTLALTAQAGRYPREVVGPDGGVAVRVSPHPAVGPLLDAAGTPITSTSANSPGAEPATDATAAAAVAKELERMGARVLVLDGGRLPPGQPSTIVRCEETNRLLRVGVISRPELESVIDLE